MSQLKKQLQELLPELKGEAKTLKGSDAKQRYRDLKFIVKSKNSVLSACRKLKVSDDYFRKWSKKIITEKSLTALESGSTKPLNSPNKMSSYLEKKIIKLRKSEPYLGPDRIKFQLNIKRSVSAIACCLRRNGLVSKQRQKRLTKRHMKRYRRSFPGYLQMDFKYVPYLIGGKQYYQLSCVDHHSSWRMIRMYPAKSLVSVENFLNQLINHCPFTIMELQTDNDTAFTDKFWGENPGFVSGQHLVDLWCHKNNIRHKLIPIGEKELNGKVENTHKQDDREYFSQILTIDYESLKRTSLNYEYNWNFKRATKALDWLTPVETIKKAEIKAMAWLKYIKEKYTPKPKKVKKISSVNRYLKWLEEDAKKYSRGLFLLPPMSQENSFCFFPCFIELKVWACRAKYW